jgi:hypothetical protein
MEDGKVRDTRKLLERGFVPGAKVMAVQSDRS